jgi:hypothetical protein
MIGYVTLGTKDPKKAAAFYDKIAAELGAGRFMDNDRIIAWGKPGGSAGICLALPFDGKPMTIGNGVMAAFAAKDKAAGRPLARAGVVARRHLRRPSRTARHQRILRGLFPRPRRQQAQRLCDGLTHLPI